jgi:hypothetical protein
MTPSTPPNSLLPFPVHGGCLRRVPRVPRGLRWPRVLPPMVFGSLLLLLLPLSPGEWVGKAGGMAGLSAQQAPVQQASAQEASAEPPLAQPPPGSVRVHLVPSLGWYFPSGLLYRSDYPPARARMNRAVMLGAGIEVEAPSLPVTLRVGLERADWFHTRLVGTIPGDGFQETLTFRYRVPTAVTFLTGDLVLRPGWERGRLRPYGFLGMGVKRYAFGEEEPRDPLDFTKPMDGTGGIIRYGAGVETRVLGRTVAPELGGSFSRYVLVDDERGSRRAHPQRELTLSVKIHLSPFGGGP